jgi:D-alanine-D-alanine ligase
MTDIALITGGSNPERHVALAGARQVAAALRSRGHRVHVVDTAGGALSPDEEARRLGAAVGEEPPSAAELVELRARDLGPRLATLPEVREAESIFLVLHGETGEDGVMQALLELAGLPHYTGSGVLGSAMAMDKDVTKRLCRDAGLPVTPWGCWPLPREEADELGYPLMVKPTGGGSSVGLAKARCWEELEAAARTALPEHPELMVEGFLVGRELTVGVLEDEALAVGEIVTASGIFDYKAKYTPGAADEIFPADVPEELADRLRELALEVHRTLRLRDFSRTDFRLDADGEPYVLEVNTLPGLTATSLLPQSAAAMGIGFDELCERIALLAAGRRPGG